MDSLLNIFRYILPYSLALYFIWRSRKQRLFLLGIPFLQVMGNSIFFENVRIFWIPGSFDGPVKILFWLFVAWFFIIAGPTRREFEKVEFKRWFGKRLNLPDELLIIFLMVIWFNNSRVAFTAVSFSIQSVTNLGSMFVGYFLLRGIFANVDHQDLTQFLEALIVVNTIACFLYILHSGVRLPIYLAKNRDEFTIGGALIIRTFWVAPRLNPLTITYLFSKSKWNISTISILFITLLSIYFTYTRSYVIGYSVLIMLSQFLLSIKNWRNLSRVLATVSILLIIFGTGYYVLNTYYPQSINFISHRFSLLSSSGITGQKSTFTDRLVELNDTYQKVERVNPAIGIGFIDQVTSFRFNQVALAASDGMFIGIIYWYGVVGAVCFLCLFLLVGWRAFSLYLFSKADNIAWFWLMCFLWIGFGLYEGMFSYTLFDPRNYTIALWMFALVEARFIFQEPARQTQLSYSSPPADMEYGQEKKDPSMNLLD
jgi:hypothetical protein